MVLMVIVSVKQEVSQTVGCNQGILCETWVTDTLILVNILTFLIVWLLHMPKRLIIALRKHSISEIVL